MCRSRSEARWYVLKTVKEKSIHDNEGQLIRLKNRQGSSAEDLKTILKVMESHEET
jgi:hypothetical protein